MCPGFYVPDAVDCAYKNLSQPLYNYTDTSPIYRQVLRGGGRREMSFTKKQTVKI